MSRYFHREFLAKPDKEDVNASITARVANHNQEYPFLAAQLILSDGYNKAHLGFYAEESDEIQEVVDRAKKLKDIVVKFYEAIEAEAKELKKTNKEK